MVITLNLWASDHAVAIDQSEAERYGKIWYQSHFCVNSSKKFRVVFDCSAKFKGMGVNDFLLIEGAKYAKWLGRSAN